MPDLRRPEAEQLPAAERGVVVTAPEQPGGEMLVQIPGFDLAHVTEVRRWMPRGGELPVAGDHVLVVLADDGEAWAPAWWPAEERTTHDKGFTFHGDDPGGDRPSGYASVEWVGSVEPANALDGDTWINTAA